MFLVTWEPYHDNSEPLAVYPSEDEARSEALGMVKAEESGAAYYVWRWSDNMFERVGGWYPPRSGAHFGVKGCDHEAPLWIDED